MSAQGLHCHPHANNLEEQLPARLPNRHGSGPFPGHENMSDQCPFPPEACAMQVPDPKLKYQQLLMFAKKLPPLDKRFQTDENKVRGCVSQVNLLCSCACCSRKHSCCSERPCHAPSVQVWVVPELRDDQMVYWKADSDSQLTKVRQYSLASGLKCKKAVFVPSGPWVSLVSRSIPVSTI